jgi:lysophospholipase L1-like esterase
VAPVAISVVGVTLVGGALVAARASRTVRRMRLAGRRVAPLAHDVDLPGRFPPRWLVVLGDSAAAGHGIPDPELALPRRLGATLVARDGRATAVRSVAVDGATTASVAREQASAATDAEVVVVGVGVNDAVRPRQPLEDVEVATRDLLLRVLAMTSPTGTVVLLSCPDLSAAPGLPRAVRGWVGRRCRAVAAVQREVAAELGIPVVDATREDVSAELFGDDGFHPGPAAVDLLVDRIVAHLPA